MAAKYRRRIAADQLKTKTREEIQQLANNLAMCSAVLTAAISVLGIGDKVKEHLTNMMKAEAAKIDSIVQEKDPAK